MQTNIIDTIKYRGKKIEASIDYDYLLDHQFHPAEEERLIRYCLSHRRYNLINDTKVKPGDGQPPYGFKIPEEGLIEWTKRDVISYHLSSRAKNLIREAEKAGEDYIHFYLLDWQAVKDALLLTYPDIIWMAVVDMYDHSGQSLHLCGYNGPHARWDSGTVGFAFLTAGDVQGWYDKPQVTTEILEKAKDQAKSEFNRYNDWVKGEIYAFVSTDADGEFIDSCGGWFGSDYENMLEEAKAGIDANIDATIKAHIKRRKRDIRGAVGIQYRQPLAI